MAEATDLLAGFAVRLRQLRERAGDPSYEVLARLTAGTRWPQTRSTIYDKLNGKSVPSEEFVRAFVSACLAHARRFGRELGGRDADLDWWAGECTRLRRAVGQARRHSGMVTSADTAWIRRLVRDWDPFVLGVHHAIRVGTPAARLPAYVERPHDGELATLIAPALESPRAASQIIILVGGSSTGKTRTAYEAALRYLPDWSMTFPAAAEDLIAVLQASKVTRRTVVWLNEAQAYLSAPACAAALRRFLADRPGQVIMLGTLWPAYRDEFTAVPASGQPDTYRHARELLSTAAIVTVPDRFTSREITQARQMTGDPRLAAAVAGSGTTGKVTQILAAGLELISRFDTADSYSRAVVVAAIDAARLGCSAPLPAGYLSQAAGSYLDDEARADPPADWWQCSLQYVTAKVRQAVAMLVPVRLRPGLGEADGYRLADYLLQHGLHARTAESVPRATWQALYETITDTGDRLALAFSAERYGYLRLACLFATQAAAEGDIAAADCLTRILSRAGHHEEAQHYECEVRSLRIRHATATGAMRRVQAALDRAEHAEAERRCASPTSVPVPAWDEKPAGRREDKLREAASSGDLRKRIELSWLLHEQRRTDEAVGLWLADALGGDCDAMLRLASILELAGQLEEATTWAQRACADNTSYALIKLTTLLERQQRTAEAAAAWRSVAEQGDPHAMRELAFLLANTGDTTQAERWHRHATAFGAGNYLWLAGFLERNGRTSEAQQIRKFGVEPGGETARPW